MLSKVFLRLAPVLFLPLLLGVLPAQNGDRVRTLEFESKGLGKEVPVSVHLPEGFSAKERYPVIYFLHGIRGSHETWSDRGADEVFDGLVAKKKLPRSIVVCPHGEFGFYINWKGDEKRAYEDMVIKDLIPFIEKKFPVRAEKKSRALLGDSMGGFGALVLALRHPAKFQAVAAHSAAIFPEDREGLPAWVSRPMRGRPSLINRMFGDPVDEALWRRYNVFSMVNKKEASKALSGLGIYFDVGKSDRYQLGTPNAAWARELKAKKIDHEFHLREGGHGRRFFMANLPASLAFLGKALGGSRRSD